ncbi:MAG: hypothetical protein AAGF31_01710 [Planctomycetota bacterium]
MKTPRLRKLIVGMVTAVVLATAFGPAVEQADAQRFGFRGGFRGGFGRSFGRGVRGFNRGFRGFNRGFNRGFARSGFRGFRGFGRSRFNSLAFRRGFGFNRFGFNRFGGNRVFARRGFGGFNRFGGFGGNHFNTFAVRKPHFGGFPHSGFRHGGFHRGFAPGFHQPGFATSFAARQPQVVTVQRPVFVTNQYVLPESVADDRRVTTGRGWKLLEEGKPHEAKKVFQQEIADNPKAGIPKIGFALAVADYGKLEKGAWAMRRAFAVDPENVANMMLEDLMRGVVERVTRAYEDDADENGLDADNTFMMVALYQMQGEPEMAEMAIAEIDDEDAKKTSTANLVALVESEMGALPMTTGRGWDLLADGDAAAAARWFAGRIEQDTTAAVPKVGYALASAARGNLDRGVWALRRAFLADADAVSQIMLSGKLRPQIQAITEAYEQSLAEAGPNADAEFMLAALYQLQGEELKAMGMVEQAMQDSPSEGESGEKETAMLASMIEEEMQANEAIIEQASAGSDSSEQADLNAADGAETATPTIGETVETETEVMTDLPMKDAASTDDSHYSSEDVNDFESNEPESSEADTTETTDGSDTDDYSEPSPTMSDNPEVAGAV